MHDDQRNLKKQVIDGGFCVGCGACAATPDSPFGMEVNSYGFHEPIIRNEGDHNKAGAVCPFYNSTEDEDSLARQLYGHASGYDLRTGFHEGIYAGHVSDQARRMHSSSGGIVTWVLERLMRNERIDAVIHVGESREDSSQQPLFSYQISHSPEQIRARARSRYHAVEISEVIDFVRNNSGNYAFVGVPCYVKAIRLLARQEPLLRERIAFCIAIFCGHMKSPAHAESIAWQAGIAPRDLKKIDFRAKNPRTPANRYDAAIQGFSGKYRRIQTKQLYGADWGLGMFKPGACDYCDDISGEVADLSCGDAWLARYVADFRGTSIVISRNRLLDELLREGIRDGSLILDTITADDVYESQAANFRHRRDGLSWRLWNLERLGRWHPPKRVKPMDSHLSTRDKEQYLLRERIAQTSHELFRQARRKKSFLLFRLRMAPLLWKYQYVRGQLPGYLYHRLRRDAGILWHRLIAAMQSARPWRRHDPR